MGRRKNKDLAEFQFDASAKPISLNHQFENFLDFPINLNTVESVEEEVSFPYNFSIQHDDIKVPPESLIVIANDLDPIERDRFALEADQSFELEKDDENSPIPFSDIDDISDKPEVLPEEKVDSVKFQIAHSKINQQVKINVDNKVVAAVRLVNLAIDKMSERQKINFKFKEIDDKFHSNPRQMLIDKSFKSIRFINDLGHRLLEHYSDRFPDRFKDFPKDEKLYVEWSNKTHRDRNKLDLIITSAIIATKLKISNIELNDYCGIDMGFDLYGCLFTTHQFLHILNLHTIDINSNRFLNFSKVVLNFSKVHGGRRLYYLEQIVKRAYHNELFFEAHHNQFVEEVGYRWKDKNLNGLSNCIDQMINERLIAESKLDKSLNRD